eukprot:Hpha_TRINITY_DN35934_c0_g1::TRINITY_DN35934_c0_g1_i1::g.184889::m.184889
MSSAVPKEKGTPEDERSYRMVFYWGAAYFFCSSSMLLANKVAIHFIPAPVFVTTVQYIFSALVPFVLGRLGYVENEPLSMKTVLVFWRVPALFAAAIFANSKVLQTANVETFIVFRNTTPILVSICDFFFMGKALPDPRTFFSFVVIVAGSVIYTLTDQGFLLESYLWIVAYLVVIVTEMIYVKHVLNTVKMTTWGRVFYTNLLSLPFQPFFAVLTNEQNTWSKIVFGEIAVSMRGIVALAIACVGGFGISFSGMGFRASVNATTFTLCGVCNKMLTITINRLMWSKHANNVGMTALVVSLCCGLLYRPSGPREDGSCSDTLYQRLVGFDEGKKAAEACPARPQESPAPRRAPPALESEEAEQDPSSGK